MKINYDLIKLNLATYQEAKSILPVISEYERDEIPSSVMRNSTSFCSPFFSAIP